MSSARAASVTEALHESGELKADERIESVDQLPGGWSRYTHLAHAALSSGERRGYIVRVKPEGALLDTSLELEYQVYQALDGVPVPTPRVYAFVAEERNAFGGPFIVMEHVPGSAMDMYSRADQARLASDWAGPRRIAQDMVQTLAAIHRLGREQLPPGVPELSFADVLHRWQDVYRRMHLVRDPVIEEAFDWASERAPAEPWLGLVHGDYRIGNTLIADGRIRAVLDWELVHYGDVRFDLGYLAIARGAGKHLRSRSPLMGTFAEQDWFLERYAELTGRRVDIDCLATFQMLSIMMLLATQLTAVWMFKHGVTTDFRMAWSRFSFAGLRQDMIRLMGW